MLNIVNLCALVVIPLGALAALAGFRWGYILLVAGTVAMTLNVALLFLWGE